MDPAFCDPSSYLGVTFQYQQFKIYSPCQRCCLPHYLLTTRRWYSDKHSCLPSSWPGFDSRPTQLFFLSRKNEKAEKADFFEPLKTTVKTKDNSKFFFLCNWVYLSFCFPVSDRRTGLFSSYAVQRMIRLNLLF